MVIHDLLIKRKSSIFEIIFDLTLFSTFPVEFNWSVSHKNQACDNSTFHCSMYYYKCHYRQIYTHTNWLRSIGICLQTNRTWYLYGAMVMSMVCLRWWGAGCPIVFKYRQILIKIASAIDFISLINWIFNKRFMIIIQVEMTIWLKTWLETNRNQIELNYFSKFEAIFDASRKLSN